MSVPVVSIRPEYQNDKLIGFGVFNSEVPIPSRNSLIGVLTLNEFEKLAWEQGYTRGSVTSSDYESFKHFNSMHD